MVLDINGLSLGEGDIITPVSGEFRGTVCQVKTEDGMGFVCVRISHRPYSKGVWYAADHVQRLQKGKPNRRRSRTSASKPTGRKRTTGQTRR